LKLLFLILSAYFAGIYGLGAYRAKSRPGINLNRDLIFQVFKLILGTAALYGGLRIILG
jgi:hypothetical protein